MIIQCYCELRSTSFNTDAALERPVQRNSLQALSPSRRTWTAGDLIVRRLLLHSLEDPHLMGSESRGECAESLWGHAVWILGEYIASRKHTELHTGRQEGRDGARGTLKLKQQRIPGAW